MTAANEAQSDHAAPSTYELMEWPPRVIGDWMLGRTVDTDMLVQELRAWADNFWPDERVERLTSEKTRLVALLLEVPGAVQTEMAYEDWWGDLVSELEAQGIAKPTPFDDGRAS